MFVPSIVVKDHSPAMGILIGRIVAIEIAHCAATIEPRGPELHHFVFRFVKNGGNAIDLFFVVFEKTEKKVGGTANSFLLQEIRLHTNKKAE